MSVDGDWVRPIVSGLVAAVVVFVLSMLATRAPEDKTGWQRIVPSAMHWTAVALGTAAVLLMGYVRLFVGSSRADAEQQMAILTWLIAAFALGTIVVALSMAEIRRRAIRFRGAQVTWQSDGREVAADLGSLRELRGSWQGYAVLCFRDGTILRLDPYARGAPELIERAQQRLAEGGEPGDR